MFFHSARSLQKRRLQFRLNPLRGKYRRRTAAALSPKSGETLELRLLLTTAPAGEQFVVAESFGLEENPPAVAVRGDGGFTSVWTSYDEDGSGSGIFGQRFDANGVPAATPRFQVNTQSLGEQSAAAIATDTAGNVLVVWQSKGQDGSGYGIYGQWYTAAGIAQGSEFRINSTTTGDQMAPAVAIDGSGQAVIAWQGPDSDGWGVFYARVANLSDVTGAELPVNIATAGDQQNPTVAAAANGNFVIAWEAIDPLGGSDASLDIYAKVYSSTDPVPAGEFRVNTETLRDQVTPDAAIDADGDFVIVWVGGGIPGSGSDVFGQRFSELAVAQGSQFRVNNTTLASQVSGVVDMDAGGNFLVAWQSVHQDGFSEGIYGRQYNASGATLVDEFLVNTVTEGPQTTPAIGMNASGRAVVAWRGKNEEHQSAVFAQRFQTPDTNLADLKVGGELSLGTFVELEANGPSGTMANSGNSVVVWESFEQDGEGMGVYAQRLDNFGDPIGVPFLVNTAFTAGNQGAPAVAGNGDGDFVVTWHSQGQDGSGYGIYGQRYKADGTPIDGAFLVNTTTTGDQTSPAVAMGDDGRFVIVWQGVAPDGSMNIYARRYDALGVPAGGEFQVNNFEVKDQVSPAIAMNALGEFAIAWVSSHPADTIPEIDPEKSVFVQWFNASGVATGDEVIAHVYVKDAQEFPSIGIDAAGNFVVAWQSIGQDGSTWGVYARQFRRDKTPVQVEGEFLVNETTDQLQRNVGVGVEAGGDFVITWESTSLGTDDGSSTEIYRREYFADGTPDGGENLVNTWTAGPQTLPVVARAATGNYGIFWQGQGFSHVDGVHGRLYDVNLSDDPGTPSRIPVTDQFLVGATLGFETSSPAIAVDADGSITLAFETFEEDGSGFGIFAERFHADGTPIEGSRVQVNLATQDDQSAPSVATDGNGNILIVWQSKDASGFGIFGQWFTLSPSDGSLVKSGTEFRLNATTAGDQTRPDVAMDASGRAVVAWQSADQDGSGLGVYYTRLDSAGDTTGTETLANDTTAGDQQLPSVAAAATSGQFVIAWQGPGPVVEGEASVEVFAKRYTAAGAEVGDEFPVNSDPAKDQIAPDVAMDSDGDAVFVWQAEGQQSSGSDVFIRRMNSSGGLLGSDLRVNTTPERPQRAPSVAMDANGNHLVAWQSQHQDGFSWGVYGHEYAADGTSLAGEFAINERVEGPQTIPSVAINASGQGVVAWLGNDSTHLPSVFAHRYSVPNVEPDLSVGTEFKLTNFVGLEETPPAAAMNANREAVVVWTSYAEDGSGMGVFGQMLDRQGLPLSGRFTVNTFTTGNQSAPAVARNAAGQFVIAWQSEAEDGDGYAVYGQLYSSSGVPVDGTPFRVNTTTAGDQMAPAVAMADDGSFVIVWQSTSADGSLDIMAQRYDASGGAVDGEFRINNLTGLDQKDPSIAMNGSGQFVVAWVSDHPALTDPLDTEKSIFVQWFNAAGVSTGNEVLVHRFVKDAQEAPAVGIDPLGRFVVAWQSINQDGNSWGVFARRFNADKSAVERREFVVNESRQGPQRYVGVGMDDFGRFVVTWQTNSRAELAGGGASAAAADEGGGGGSGEESSSWEVCSRQYHFTGRAEGGEVLVNQWQMGPQIRPVVAQAPGGDFGLFWLGQGPDHVEGVHGRLYQSLFEFGDAPDPVGPNPGQYPTLAANDGPRHLPGSGLTLGNAADSELEGQQSANANGDDTDAAGDDEDGVVLPSLLVRGLTATATVNASMAGKLDAWIDFNRDGEFDPDERIAAAVDLVAGANTISFTVPATAVTGVSYARFRISSSGGLAPTGVAVDGEVEDYKVDIVGAGAGSASLVDDPENPGQKVLLISGTTSGDNITLTLKRGGKFEVRGNRRSWGLFDIAEVSRIIAFGSSGNDTIKIDSRLNIPATMYGEAGNDRLYGGSGRDALYGGDGNDSLYGGRGEDSLWGGAGNDLLRGGADNDRIFGEAGLDKLYADSGSDLLIGGADNDRLYGGTSRDLLIGGTGVDYLNGGSADDILIGGSTTHDSNFATLQAILNDWRTDLAFGVRISQLGALLNLSTVIGDGLRDTQYGSFGRDWMLDYELLDTFSGFSSNPATGDQKN